MGHPFVLEENSEIHDDWDAVETVGNVRETRTSTGLFAAETGLEKVRLWRRI